VTTSRLNPYIMFQGDAREAMEFYQQVFGGKLSISTFGEFDSSHAEIADKVMHSLLETDSGYTIMAGDTPPGMEDDTSDNITISLSGTAAEELRGYWKKLSESGTVSQPLEKQMWGDEYGACVDGFGITWMVNISEESQDASPRAI
jgi:PhnB protein